MSSNDNERDYSVLLHERLPPEQYNPRYEMDLGLRIGKVLPHHISAFMLWDRDVRGLPLRPAWIIEPTYSVPRHFEPAGRFILAFWPVFHGVKRGTVARRIMAIVILCLNAEQCGIQFDLYRKQGCSKGELAAVGTALVVIAAGLLPPLAILVTVWHARVIGKGVVEHRYFHRVVTVVFILLVVIRIARFGHDISRLQEIFVWVTALILIGIFSIMAMARPYDPRPRLPPVVGPVNIWTE